MVHAHDTRILSWRMGRYTSRSGQLGQLRVTCMHTIGSGLTLNACVACIRVHAYVACIRVHECDAGMRVHAYGPVPVHRDALSPPP